MTATIAPGQSVTFTITSVPDRTAQRKTIRRLMNMQPQVQRDLRKLARKRRQELNRTYIRAGVPWTSRVKATRIARLAPGAQFTLHLTPQIMDDVRSVEEYLEAGRAS